MRRAPPVLMAPQDRQVRPDQQVPLAPQVPLAQWELQDRPGLQVRSEQLARPVRPERLARQVPQELLAPQDRQVRPGARYGYRLGVRRGEREDYFAETWIVVPARAEFALGGPMPNPVLDDLKVSFSLPGPESATLELLDVSGRRLTARQVGGLGAGSHVVSLAAGTRLTPGIYFLRLRQGGRVSTARACVLR